MIFTETALKGAIIIDPEIIEDERGFFARIWSAEEFAGFGMKTSLVQTNLSFNKKRGTLRGMHFQIAPFAQAKLVQCIAGSIYDVVIDLRRDSPTFKQWTAVELSAANHRMLYVPEYFAHGFQTLEDNSEVFYHMSEAYAPEGARGVRWDDPAFAVDWPVADRIIIARDRDYPDFVG